MASVYELALLSEAVYHAEDGSMAGEVEGFRPEIAFGNPKKGFYAVFFRKVSNQEPIFAIRGTDMYVGRTGIGDLSDLGADAQLAAGSVPHQFYDADKHIKEIQNRSPGRSFYVTGHSLGGGLASLVGAKYRVPTVTFNAPGMRNSYASLISGASPASIGALSMATMPPTMMYMPVGMPSVEASQRLLSDIDKRQQAKASIQSMDTSKMLNIRASGDVVSIGTGPAIGKVENITVQEGSLNGWEKAVGIVLPIVGIVQGGNYALAQHSMANVCKALADIQKYQMNLGWMQPVSAPVPPPRTGGHHATQRVHTVAAGESLSLIAKKYYGDPKKWNVIYAVPANKTMIGPNPNMIRVGLKLIVP